MSEQETPSKSDGHTWALMLAGGEGSRLRSLTTTKSGITVPKQFCSLSGRGSLLDATLRRARSIVDAQRVCVVVTAHHRCWWEAPLRDLPSSHVVVQPLNKGTANGILLPLLHILEEDADARVIILPSDHHVRREDILQDAALRALRALRDESCGIVLLGAAPERPDEELGYIVPGSRCGEHVYEVADFVEKPSQAEAARLMGRGGLWNVFIIAARARALLAAFEREHSYIVHEAQRLVRARRDGQIDGEIERFYEALPQLDFSRHVAQTDPTRLRVLRVPRCGWSDLGTPLRVREVLKGVSPARRASARARSSPAFVNLAEQCARAECRI